MTKFKKVYIFASLIVKFAKQLRNAMKNNRTSCGKELSAWSELTMQLSIRNYYLFFRDRNLSHSQVIVLHFLQRNGTSTVTDIGKALSVSNPAASQMLDDLVHRELVSRREKTGDRRVRLHDLTGKGTDLLHQAALARQKWQSGLIENLNQEEQMLVSKALRLLNEKLSAMKPKEEAPCCHPAKGKNHD